MWTALLLLCSVEGNCFAFGGPIVQSESECIQSIPDGVKHAKITLPQYRVVNYKCVQWIEGA